MIVLDDKIFEQPMWKENRIYSKFEIWLCFLREAKKREQEIIDGNVRLTVGDGLFYTSYKTLAYSFRWTVPQITKYIKSLQAQGVIDIEQIKSTKSIVIDVKEVSSTMRKEDRCQMNTVESKCYVAKPRKSATSDKRKEPRFDFGKYCGLKISRCRDVQYLQWVYRNVEFDDFVRYAIESRIDELEGNKYI